MQSHQRCKALGIKGRMTWGCPAAQFEEGRGFGCPVAMVAVAVSTPVPDCVAHRGARAQAGWLQGVETMGGREVYAIG